MREQRKFMGSVKGHDPGQSPATGEEGTEPAIGEDSGNEILAQTRVPKAPLFFDRQKRIRRDEGVSEETAAFASRRAATLLMSIHAHTFHPTARRVLLQHVAGEIEGCQGSNAPRGEAAHRERPVASTLGRHKVQTGGILLEADRLAWDAHPE